MFVNDTSGSLVDVTAPDGSPGKAFVPAPLPDDMPALSASTILAVAEARAALAALDKAPKADGPSPHAAYREMLQIKLDSLGGSK